MADTPSQPAAAVREPATRLARAVAGLRDVAWLEALGRLGAAPDDAAPADPPSFAALAGPGVDTVQALAAAGRWDDAADHAGHLTRVFRAHRAELHPVVGEAFDGLRAAALARDPDELTDFIDLLREVFDGSGPTSG